MWLYGTGKVVAGFFDLDFSCVVSLVTVSLVAEQWDQLPSHHPKQFEVSVDYE